MFSQASVCPQGVYPSMHLGRHGVCVDGKGCVDGSGVWAGVGCGQRGLLMWCGWRCGVDRGCVDRGVWTWGVWGLDGGVHRGGGLDRVCVNRVCVDGCVDRGWTWTRGTGGVWTRGVVPRDFYCGVVRILMECILVFKKILLFVLFTCRVSPIVLKAPVGMAVIPRELVRRRSVILSRPFQIAGSIVVKFSLRAWSNRSSVKFANPCQRKSHQKYSSAFLSLLRYTWLFESCIYF